MNSNFKLLLPALSLFASAGTMVCCALPALLVTLGLGAAMAGLAASAPWLLWLSDHKAAIFTVAGLLLAAAAALQWKARNAPCPADPAKAKACAFLRRAGIGALAVSMLFYLTGLFFAFFAADIFFS